MSVIKVRRRQQLIGTGEPISEAEMIAAAKAVSVAVGPDLAEQRRRRLASMTNVRRRIGPR
ncbi:MAG: hypothetical protein NTY30_02820 [Candidatus Berkelbacteria bacterium]|nr:hypothetical protein [Candidatus Berkelbacteria bacterium]